MAQIFFQANILSDEISFPWIFHCAAHIWCKFGAISGNYQCWPKCSFNAQLHIYQPISASCFPMTRNCDLSLKTFLPCLQLIVIVYQKANCYPVQCNTEWPEWSKQSLYNTPVTLMVGQLCDTLCVKLCDNMWHCVLQCVTLYDTLWHSVTLCDSGSVCHWWPRWLVICDTVLHHRFVHRQPWCSIIWWDTTGRDWYGLAQLVQYDLFLQMFYDLLDINS